MSQLDEHTFTCNKCNGSFKEADGTWLPIGREPDRFMQKLSVEDDMPQIFNYTMKPPEIITSPEFTCYDCVDLVACPNCTKDIDGDPFNCNTCGNAGMVTPERAKQVNEANQFWNEMLSNTKS